MLFLHTCYDLTMMLDYDLMNVQPRGDKDMITLRVDKHSVWTTTCPSTPDTYATCMWQRPCECKYVEGKEPAHYPVPAIRLEVDICKTWDNEVHIWEGNAAVYSYVCLSKGY